MIKLKFSDDWYLKNKNLPLEICTHFCTRALSEICDDCYDPPDRLLGKKRDEDLLGYVK